MFKWLFSTFNRLIINILSINCRNIRPAVIFLEYKQQQQTSNTSCFLAGPKVRLHRMEPKLFHFVKVFIPATRVVDSVILPCFPRPIVYHAMGTASLWVQPCVIVCIPQFGLLF